MSATCKSCGAPIFWARTERGHTIPVDVEPVVGGNLERITGHNVEPPVMAFVSRDQRSLFDSVEPARLYVSHFATCPQASQHRKKS